MWEIIMLSSLGLFLFSVGMWIGLQPEFPGAERRKYVEKR